MEKGSFDLAKVGRSSSNVAARRQSSKYSVPSARGFLQVWTPAYATMAVLLILAISVWAKGLFFNYSALLVAGFVLASLGFLAGWLDRKALYLLIPWAAAALGYTIALSHAVDTGTAEQGAFLHWTLVAMAAGGLVMAKDAVLTRRFLGLVGYLSAILAFAIPLTTGHWLNVPGAIFAPNRWATVFQYPDTAGAVFGAGYLGLSFLRPPSLWEPWIKRGAAMVNGAGLILSLSRGADLIMPFALIAGVVVVAERGVWTRMLNEFVGAGVGGLLLSFLWRGSLPSSHAGPAIFLAIVAGAVAIWEGLEFVWRKIHLTGRQSWLAGIAAMVAVAALGGVYVHHKSKEPVVATAAKPYAITTTHPLVGGLLNVAVSGPATVVLQGHSRYDNVTTLAQETVKSTASLRIPPLGAGNQAMSVTVTPVTGSVAVTRLAMAPKTSGASVNLLPWFVHVMPESIYSRIVEVSGRQLSVWQRAVFVSNGMIMAEKNPLWGYGAGGWAADYRAFQTLPYTSREVHDGWVQWWIDGGGLAGLGFAALMAGAVYGIWRSRRLTNESRWAAAGLAAVTVALLGHSLVDWDLSFFWDELFLAAVWSAFMGLALGAEGPAAVPEKKGWPLWTAAAVSVAMALFTFNLAQAQGYLQAANSAASAKKPNDTTILSKVDVAVGDQPNLGNAQVLKAELLANLSTQSKSGVDFQEANQAYQKALTLIPTSASAFAAYGNYLVVAKQYPLALKQFMRAIQLAPMRAASLYPAWEGLYNVAVAGLSDGNEALTKAAAHDLQTAFRDYAKEQASIPTGMIPSLQLPAPAGADQLAEGLSYLMQNQQKAAAKAFATVTPSTLAATGHEWMEIIALTKEPKFWKAAGLLGTVAKNLADWGLVK